MYVYIGLYVFKNLFAVIQVQSCLEYLPPLQLVNYWC